MSSQADFKEEFEAVDLAIVQVAVVSAWFGDSVVPGPLQGSSIMEGHRGRLTGGQWNWVSLVLR